MELITGVTQLITQAHADINRMVEDMMTLQEAELREAIESVLSAAAAEE